jgi:hypothetical protein
VRVHDGASAERGRQKGRRGRLNAHSCGWKESVVSLGVAGVQQMHGSSIKARYLNKDVVILPCFIDGHVPDIECFE